MSITSVPIMLQSSSEEFENSHMNLVSHDSDWELSDDSEEESI